MHVEPTTGAGRAASTMRHRSTARRIALLAGAAAAIAVVALAAIAPLKRGPIDARGGRTMHVPAMVTPHFMQTDPRWGSAMLGPTSESLAASGCTVCCLSMALARYGVDIPPGELNRRIEALDGFTEVGWLKWSSVAKITGGRFVAETPSAPRYDEIDDAIESGWPILAKIRLRSIVPHWVLIVGKEGTEYLARDPLVEHRLVRVSERSAVIEAARMVRGSESEQ